LTQFAASCCCWNQACLFAQRRVDKCNLSWCESRHNHSCTNTDKKKQRKYCNTIQYTLAWYHSKIFNLTVSHDRQPLLFYDTFSFYYNFYSLVNIVEIACHSELWQIFNSASKYSLFSSDEKICGLFFQNSCTQNLEQVDKNLFQAWKQYQTIFIDRSLRRHKPSLAIMSSAFCLAASNLLLGAGCEQVTHHGACNFLTFLWHWMFLSAWFWFCAMANNLKHFVEKVRQMFHRFFKARLTCYFLLVLHLFAQLKQCLKIVVLNVVAKANLTHINNILFHFKTQNFLIR